LALILVGLLIFALVNTADDRTKAKLQLDEINTKLENLQEENQQLKTQRDTREKAKAAKKTTTPTKATPKAVSIPTGKTQIIEAIYKEFWPDDRLVSLVNCESGFNVTAVGYDASHNQYNYGLFQVSQYHGYSHEYLSVPVNNIKVARQIYNRQGWGAWPTCARLAGLL